MEEELDGVAPCSSLAVEAMIRFGAAGAVWGLCAGPSHARQQGQWCSCCCCWDTKLVTGDRDGRFGFCFLCCS